MRLATLTTTAALLVVAVAAGESPVAPEYVGPSDIVEPSTVFGIKTQGGAVPHVYWIREGRQGDAQPAACPADPAFAGARCYRLVDAPLGPANINADVPGANHREIVRITRFDGPAIASLRHQVVPHPATHSCRLTGVVRLLGYRRATLTLSARATTRRRGRRLVVAGDRLRARFSSHEARNSGRVSLRRIPRSAGRVRVDVSYVVTAGSERRTDRATYVLRADRRACPVTRVA